MAEPARKQDVVPVQHYAVAQPAPPVKEGPTVIEGQFSVVQEQAREAEQTRPEAQGASRPKIGAGHAQAWFRAGLKELSQILPAFPDGVRPVEEPGLAGNLTNIEVVRDKEAEPEAKSPLQEARDRAQAQAKAAGQERGQEQNREIGG